MATAASLTDIAHEAKRLEGKVALITGGARGLGLAVQDAIGAQFATYVHCDVTKETDVENAVNLAISKYQKLDIIVNNAMLIDDAKPSILDNEVAEFERVLRVNIIGPFLGIKHAARVMIPAKKGSIVNMGSICSSVGGVATHAYTSSKHGLIGLTKNAAAELGNFGLRVNCLSPSFVANNVGVREFFKFDDEGCSNNVYSNLKGVCLLEEDVANAALYLASDESKYISGHNLAIDGVLIQCLRLEGKVALITGGARGLGECIAKLFCKHGAMVVIADIRDQQGLAVQDSIGAQFATYIHCDVTKETEVENAINLAISKY
ncbi:hypothetical protein PIB30_093704 [Stylosanthes scabra]|uniref:Uncharacterized protein n=1 Tax=Stylosanthes scabra TaxID=79078 RepID=A0ABU6UXR1_9FABA|nr:hypothetical protein [Stylosanthes scabra]